MFAHIPKLTLIVVSDGTIFTHVANLATKAIDNSAIFTYVTYFVPVVIAGCAVFIHLTELVSIAIVNVHYCILSQRVRGTQSIIRWHGIPFLSLHVLCYVCYLL